MQSKKLSDKYKKRVVCYLSDYEYGELLASLKYEGITYPTKMIRFFIESYLAGDSTARAILDNYKEKNKIAGRSKKEYVNKQETLAKKTESLYDLDEEDIESIYDVLDEVLP